MQFDASILARDFGALLGAEHVRIPRDREALIAALVVEPQDDCEVAEVVRRCERDRIPLAPLGAMRTQRLMRPVPLGLSLVRMNRAVAYEPHDMTVVAEAGVTLDSLNQLAAQHGQRLPADPPAPELTTLGSLIAGAKAGPLRLSEGTIRDLLIGIRFVGHDGRIVHAGGRVVKNVAGYDLMKLMTGSFGTLGIIIEAACKVRPIPPDYHLAVAGLGTLRAAFEAAQNAERVAALFHCEVLSAALAGQFFRDAPFVLMAGFGGIRAEVESQRSALISALPREVRIVEGAEADAAYQCLRDLTPPSDADVAAHLAVRPAELARCLEACGGDFKAHALNGVAQIWRRNVDDGAADGLIANWRVLARSAGGHLRLLAAPGNLHKEVGFFDEPPRAAAALMRRLKAVFDPAGIFNPNCFVAGRPES
jgi:glycolate oxidase FAD binding subunit